MKKTTFLVILFSCFFNGFAQPANRPVLVAGVPVNYDENLVGSYTLPDLFALSNGKRVADARTWLKKRRPELVKLFEEIQFGKLPPRPRPLKFDVFDKGTPVFNGKAVRKQVTVYLTEERSPDYKLNLVIYLPANIRKKAPLLLNISFSAPNQVVDDAGLPVGEIWNRENKKVKADRSAAFGKINVEQFIDAGLGFATFYYGDVEPDFKDGIKYGIRGHYLKAGQTEPAKDEWGAISAWAWGLSRAMDYFETDNQIDSQRIALQGASRLGKTVLWAGAHDTRFKLVIASISGEGGAALSRRNYGETIKHITVLNTHITSVISAYYAPKSIHIIGR